MKKIMFVLIFGIMLISLVSAGTITTTLNSPADGSTQYYKNVTTNATGSVTGGASLTSMTLWDNSTGTWGSRNTTAISPNSTQDTETLTVGSGYSTDTQTAKYGVNLTVNQDIKVISITKTSSTNATTVYITNSAGTETYGTATFSGTVATFTTPINLNASTNYRFVADAGGLGYTRAYKSSGGTYPIVQTYLTFNSNEGTDTSEFGQIISAVVTQGHSYTTYTQTFTNTYTTSTIWNYQTCDTDSTCNFATSNRTFSIDTTAPTISVIAPNSTFNYLRNTTLLNLSVTATDTNLDDCWYSYNNTNYTFACSSGVNVNSTITQNVSRFNITVFANDTVGNVNSATVRWFYKVLERGISYAPTGIEGSSQNFLLNLSQGTGYQITTVDLVYDSTSYPMSLTRDNGNVYLTKTLDLPSVASDSNKTFNFKITLDDSSILYSESYNQTIENIGLDDCSVYTVKLLNLTIQDERLKTNLTATKNTTIEVDLSLNSYTTNSEIASINQAFVNKNPANICINKNLSTSTLFLNGIIKYFADDYATEYYNFQKEVINSTTINKNITLFDLLTTENTPFQLKVTGSNSRPSGDTIVEIWRQYVADGDFKIVEILKTDTDGKAVANLVEKSIIYNILVKKDGVLLKSLTNVVAFCEDSVIGDCKINIQIETERDTMFNYADYYNFNYVLSYTTATRLFTLDFDIINNTNHNISFKVYSDAGRNTSKICESSLYSSSGVLSCSVPTTSSNNLYLEIYYDGEVLITDSYNIADTDRYGADKYVIMFIFVLILVGMFAFNKTGVIIAGIVGFIFAGYLSLFKGGGFAFGSSLIYLVIAGIIIIWKLNERGGES